MTRTPTRGRRLERPAVAAAAIVGAALVLLSGSRYGLGLNADSVWYAAVADNVVDHARLGFPGEPHLVTWPPLFPGLLALGAWLTPLDGKAVGLLLNAALLGVVVVETHYLLRRTVTQAWLRIAGVALVALSPGLHDVARMLWSETLFIALALGALVALQRSAGDPRRRGWLAATVAFAAAASLTRYIGVTVVIAGVVVLLVDRPAHRIRAAATFVAAALVLPVLWLVRNVILTSSVTGGRQGRETDPVGDVRALVATVGQLISGEIPGPEVAYGLAAIVLLAGLALAVTRHRPDDAPALETLCGPRRQLLPVVTFAVVYALALLVASSAVEFSTIGTRFVAPILVPLVVAGLTWTGRLLPSDDRPAGTWPSVVTGVLVAAITVFGLLSVYSAVDQLRHGTGIGSRAHAAAPIAEVLGRAPDPECRLYTNDPPAVYHWAEVESTPTPRRGAAGHGDRERIERAADRAAVCVLWVDLDPDDDLLTPAALGEFLDLVEVARDGPVTLYVVDGGSASG